MEYSLLNIQETVRKYAQIISKIAKVDVEVVDVNLFRVAGTGIFEKDINKDMSSEGYVYRHVLKTGVRQVISDPGHHPLCINCPDRYGCKESFEISTPISLRGKMIGVIGMMSSDASQKNLLAENLQIYLEFLDQISDFIAVKALEQLEAQRSAAMLLILDKVINHVDQGVLILSEDNSITRLNESAMKQLNLQETALGKVIEIVSTGDTLNNFKEYKLMLDGKSVTVMGEKQPMYVGSKEYSEILLFQNIKEMQSKMYEMTSTIKSLSTKNIIGSSTKTKLLRQQIVKVANSNSTVLITGESGTGKEMVATAIWQAGKRREKRFVAINCAAIPEALLESELFGYVKGAFTGADPNGRMGKFELANNGVIFLDEIGDMPIYLQAKLLRVLQERTIMRIGSNQVIPIDVRIIAATNKDLRQMIEEKKFREDLYYRLSVIPIEIAPLRERVDDIEELVTCFIWRYVKLFDKHYDFIKKETMERLKEHSWYGNVRELENAVEFMVNMMEPDGVLNDKTLPREFFAQKAKGSTTEEKGNSILPLALLEQQEIKRAIEKYGTTTKGKLAAAKSLEIGIATLYRKLELYGIG